MIIVRDATVDDAPALLEIYDYYVRRTAVTFDYETPSLERFIAKMRSVTERYPYLVVLDDDGIAGYAYAGPFVGRAAYDWACEVTIYLAPEKRKKGLGRLLYRALEAALGEMGILNLYACIGCPRENDEYLTTNSVDFHAHLGYSTVGRFSRCGYKFGHWYDMVWMEKIIGTHPQQPDEVGAWRGFHS